MASALEPPEKVPTTRWMTEHFRLPSEVGDKHGPYDFKYAPYLYGILAAADDPLVSAIYTMKAAQVGWTIALVGLLGRYMDTDPCGAVVMFPTSGLGKAFNDEKFEPCVKATPRLSRILNVEKTRSKDNKSDFKSYPGGFTKFTSSGSTSGVKSSTTKIAIVEEPDDATANLKSQGSSIKMLWERLKRISNSLRILGGTPSVKGLSKVEAHINQSDKRVLPIVCHDCADSHVLDWENVKWLESDDKEHPVYGRALPETAVYACPHCGSAWDDHLRKANIRNTVFNAVEAGDKNAGWVATEEFHGAAGFTELSELYSCLPGAGLEELVRDYLEAEHSASNGDENDKIVFVNSKLGRPYEFQDDNIDADTLREKALDYPELEVPRGGLLLTVGIDVQQNPARVAVIVRAWGRGEESWLVLWKEISAANSTSDKNDPVWDELEKTVYGAFKHASGGSIYASAVSIDSSDGNTNDAVYAWVRKMNKKHRRVLTMAIKGSSAQVDPEIFTTPRIKSVDHVNPKKQTKADRHGLKVYIVGTNKAKDWLAAHRKLDGIGPGRVHVYQDVRADYFDQVTGEVKAPHRNIKGRKVWQQKAGSAVEAGDGEVYALHAARAKRVHLFTPKQWDALEQKLNQSDLFAEPTQQAVTVADNETESENVADVTETEAKAKKKRSTKRKTSRRRNSRKSYADY